MPTDAPADGSSRTVDGGSAAPAASADGSVRREVMVEVASLGKRFKIYPRPSGRLVEWVTCGRAVRHEDFWALRDVSLTVRRGESVGIIGVNGSGKSTLLKILSGAMYPTEGTVRTAGQVLSLLELGTGLNPDLTGRQNVINSATLLAFPPDYVGARLRQIEAFAELGEFFDHPVRLYSSGMLVRLVFAMFACMDPDVFIVDEALSVGDVFFQQKCVARMEALRAAGTTMLFVSHDMHLVRRLCPRVLLLSHGQVEFCGPPDEAISRYYSKMGAEAARGQAIGAPPPPPPAAPAAGLNPAARAELSAHDVLRTARSRHGEGRLRLEAATFQNAAGDHGLSLTQTECATIRVLIAARSEMERPTAGLHLFDRLGNLVFAAGTAQLRAVVPSMRAGEERLITFRLTFAVQPGEYTLSIGCSEAPPVPADVAALQDQCEGIGPIAVHALPERPAPFYGLARLPMEVLL